MEGCCRPISRVLCPSRKRRAVTIYLAQPLAVKPAEVRFWRSDVTAAVKQPTRGRAGRLLSPYLALLQVGFSRRCVTADGRTLLPSDFTLILPPMREGRYVSVPLSVPDAGSYEPESGPGSYPAPCPEEPGLSSLPINRDGGHPVCMTLRFEL